MVMVGAGAGFARQQAVVAQKKSSVQLPGRRFRSWQKVSELSMSDIEIAVGTGDALRRQLSQRCFDPE
jgi:hypothetical protein